MHVIVASNELYAGQVSALMHSVAAHSPEAYLWILDCGIDPATLDRLASFGRERLTGFNSVSVDLTTFDGIDLQSWGAASLARLLIPQIVPKDLDRAIYLDADTLTLAPLAELMDLPMDDDLVAGVSDPVAHARDVVPTAYYINCGMMVLNLTAWRDDDISRRALSFLRDQPFRFLDQSAINAVARGRIRALPPEWNYIIGFVGTNLFSLPVGRLPKIVHFAGCDPLPWTYSDAPYSEIYLHHRQSGPLPIRERLVAKRGWLRRSIGLLRRKRGHLLHAYRMAEGRDVARRCLPSFEAGEVTLRPAHTPSPRPAVPR